MAILNFPSAPTSGDIYAGYMFDGARWNLITIPLNQLSNGSYALTIDSTGDTNVPANLTITGGLTVSGTTTYVESTNTVYTDNLLELHSPSGGVGKSWTSSDGKDIGIRMHYYNGGAKSAALILAQDTGYLEWYSIGNENSGVFTGTYGTFKTGSISLVNNTASTSTTTGALTVSGGVGISGAINVGNVVTTSVTAVTISASGDITGNYFKGDGSQLTGLPTQAAIINSNSNVTINGAGGSITADVGGVRGLSLVSDRLAFGTSAGIGQALNAVALGTGAGQLNQGIGSVAVGAYACTTNQGNYAVAIGDQAAYSGQGTNAVAIGGFAGGGVQGTNAVAVGGSAGGNKQGSNAVAIGSNAGNTNQGLYSIAIGTNAGANNQPANSIVIMASSVGMPDPTNSGLYIKPVRNDTSNANVVRPIYYNTTTSEVTYGNIDKVSYTNVALNATMSIDNLRLQLQTQAGGIWLFGATSTGTATWNMNAFYSESGASPGNAGSMSNSLSATTSFQSLINSSANISRSNVSYILTIVDTTNGIMYRVTWMTTNASTGASPYGSYIAIERL